MTVKRRLFISNILMITIPVILSVTIGCITMFTLRNFFDLRQGERVGDDYRFYYAVADINDIIYSDTHKDVVTMIAELDVLKDRKRLKALSFSVFEEGNLIYRTGEELDQTAYTLVTLDIPGEHFYLFETSALYTIEHDGYKFVVSDTGYSGSNAAVYESFRHTALNRILIAFIILIFIILCTNSLLTKIVINSIITPLDQLIFGVRQIRDGNLTYRIEYKGKDEFKQVCEDFNEMAKYLQHSVDDRQKDYDSRKELLAGVSHDLRTPLTSIKGYIIGLEQGIDTSPQIRERYINVLKRKTEELEFLVNQLFLFSKIDIGDYPMQLKRWDLQRELEQMMRDIRTDYEPMGLEVRYRNFPAPAMVTADLAQLKTVLINVCENTLKYADVPQKILSVEGEIRDLAVIIRMTDNGGGVPKESLSRLFDVFYRTDKSRNDTGKGSGLGLAISKKVIERMQGTITAENGKTGGLTIRIILPLIETGEEANESDTGY